MTLPAWMTKDGVIGGDPSMAMPQMPGGLNGGPVAQNRECRTTVVLGRFPWTLFRNSLRVALSNLGVFRSWIEEGMKSSLAGFSMTTQTVR